MTHHQAAVRLVPVPDAQAYLGGIGRSKLYELIAQRELELVKIGRRSFVTTESLDAFLDRLRTPAAMSLPRNDAAPLAETSRGQGVEAPASSDYVERLRARSAGTEPAA